MSRKKMENMYLQEVGLLINELRSELGISRMEFSKRTGLNRQHLFGIEVGQRATTIYTLSIICKELEISMADFFIRLNLD